MYIQIDKLRKSYGEGGSYVQVLNGISTQVKRGQMCVILGPSGSGKSGQPAADNRGNIHRTALCRSSSGFHRRCHYARRNWLFRQ